MAPWKPQRGELRDLREDAQQRILLLLLLLLASAPPSALHKLHPLGGSAGGQLGPRPGWGRRLEAGVASLALVGDLHHGAVLLVRRVPAH